MALHGFVFALVIGFCQAFRAGELRKEFLNWMEYDEETWKIFTFHRYQLKPKISNVIQYDEIEMSVLSNINMDWYPLCGTVADRYYAFYSSKYLAKNSDVFCNFPSTNIDGNEDPPFTHPYVGSLINKGNYSTPCHSSYLMYHHLGFDYCGNTNALARCLGNLYYLSNMSYFQEPWATLPTAFGPEITKEGYTTNYYYGNVDAHCYGYPCESVLYIKFSDSEWQMKYGGYYVIDGILSRDCSDVTEYYKYSKWCTNTKTSKVNFAVELAKGSPRYRHLSKPVWFQSGYFTHGLSTNDEFKNSHFMVKLVELKETISNISYSGGSITNIKYFYEPYEVTIMTALLGGTDKADRDKWTRNSMMSEIQGQRSPSVKAQFCLASMFSEGVLDSWIIRNHANISGYDAVEYGKENTCSEDSKTCRIHNGAGGVEISSGTGPPITGPCGASFRASENFAISSGHQPFLVQILVEPNGEVDPESSARCLGTILTVRHVLTAATCFCNVDLVEYNLNWGPEGCQAHNASHVRRLFQTVISEGTPNRNYPHVQVWLEHQDPLEKQVKGIHYFNGHKYYGVGVLWVAVHPKFEPITREFNVGLVGLTYPLQFHAHLYQICLPSTSFTDSNVDPYGGLKYSVKMLSREADTIKAFTSPNGRTIYGECEDNKCLFNDEVPFLPSNKDEERLCPLLKNSDAFKKDLRNKWFEPQAQAHVYYQDRDDITHEIVTKKVICYDSKRRRHIGWCKVKPPTSKQQFSGTLWGYCDDAIGLPKKDELVEHRFFEVETTVLPNDVCKFSSKRMLTTKQCTGYVPHKPSIYEFTFDNSTGQNNFTLERYLGGFYRDFVPKLVRRKSRRRYDDDGNAMYDGTRAEFHLGFPADYKVCHRPSNKMSDMGGPTYWRLARLQTQMTSDGTRDTTQEPQDNGQSIVVLSSIQSGYSEETGATCDLNEGFYLDEEISLLATGVTDWLELEISQLPHFDKMYNFKKESFRKVINQKVTTANPAYTIFTTTITTAKYTVGVDNATTTFNEYLDVIQFDPADNADIELDEEEIKGLLPDYSDKKTNFWPISDAIGSQNADFSPLIILNFLAAINAN